jgi:hypothetical protein
MSANYLEEGLNLVNQAVEVDRAGMLPESIRLYELAVERLGKAISGINANTT